jgi:hypothetical protein
LGAKKALHNKDEAHMTVVGTYGRQANDCIITENVDETQTRAAAIRNIIITATPEDRS